MRVMTAADPTKTPLPSLAVMPVEVYYSEVVDQSVRDDFESRSDSSNLIENS